MSHIEPAIELVRAVHAKIGSAELGRLAGVPYTTVREAAERGFDARSLGTFDKLWQAAEAHTASEAAA